MPDEKESLLAALTPIRTLQQELLRHLPLHQAVEPEGHLHQLAPPAGSVAVVMGGVAVVVGGVSMVERGVSMVVGAHGAGGVGHRARLVPVLGRAEHAATPGQIKQNKNEEIINQLTTT